MKSFSLQRMLAVVAATVIVGNWTVPAYAQQDTPPAGDETKSERPREEGKRRRPRGETMPPGENAPDEGTGKFGKGLRKGPGGEQPGQPGNERLQRMMQLFERLDQDGDGKIALTDLPERLQTRLQQLDANDDGDLDREELIARLRQMRQRMMGGEGDRPRGPRPGDGKTPDEMKDTIPDEPKTDRRPRNRKGDGADSLPEQQPGNGVVEPKRPGGGR